MDPAADADTEPHQTPRPDTGRREGDVLFGYTHVHGIPPCPCRDPGNYMSAEQGAGPLDFVLRCWCGATNRGSFDDETERSEFIARHRRAAT